MRSAALVWLVLAACGGGAANRPPAATPRDEASTSTAPEPVATPPAPPAPAPAASLADDVEAIVRGYESIADAVGPGVACADVARSIADVAASIASARASVRSASRDDRAPEVDGLMVAAEPRLRPAIGAIDLAFHRCSDEPAMVRAIEELDR